MIAFIVSGTRFLDFPLDSGQGRRAAVRGDRAHHHGDDGVPAPGPLRKEGGALPRRLTRPSSTSATCASASAAFAPSTARRSPCARAAITALIGPNGAGKTTALQPPHRLHQARGRHGRASTASDISGPAPRRDRPAGHGPHLPAHPGLREDDRARERHAGGARAARRAPRHRALPAAALAAAGGGGARAGARDARRGGHPHPRGRVRRHAVGRPAQAARARARADDPAAGSCCSTSRWPASTRPSAIGCSTTSDACARNAV